MAKKDTTPEIPSIAEGFSAGWDSGNRLTMQQYAARKTMIHIRRQAKPFGGLDYVSANCVMRSKVWSAAKTTRLFIDGKVIGGLGFEAMLTHTFNYSLIEIDQEIKEETLCVALFGIPIIIIRKDFDEIGAEIETIEGFYEMLKNKHFRTLVIKLLTRERQAAYSLYHYDVDIENKKGGPADELVKWILDGRGRGEPDPKTRDEMQLVAKAIFEEED